MIVFRTLLVAWFSAEAAAAYPDASDGLLWNAPWWVTATFAAFFVLMQTGTQIAAIDA